MDLLSALHGEGTTIVLVTHDPRYAGYASREVAMQDGMLRLDTVAGSMSSSAVHSES
jgi:putative ABC transport system ATP-binding protein